MPNDKPTEFKLDLSKDKTTVTINFGLKDEEPWGHSVFAAEDLDNFIKTLSNVRASMDPLIVEEKPPAGPTNSILDPRWWIQPELLTDGVGFAIRHPGLGWLSFAIPPDSCSVLHRLLGENLARAEKMKDQKPN